MINQSANRIITIASIIFGATLCTAPVLADTAPNNISRRNSTFNHSVNSQFFPNNYFQANSLDTNYDITFDFNEQNLNSSSQNNNSDFSFTGEQLQDLNIGVMQSETTGNYVTFVNPF